MRITLGAGTTVAALVLALCPGMGAVQAHAAQTIVPGHKPYPAGGTNVAGTGIDGANQNAQLADSVGPQIEPSWRAASPTCPSSTPGSATSISIEGSVTFVLDAEFECGYLSAYQTSTGHLLWRRPYFSGPGALAFANHATGYVQDQDGDVLALNLTNGKQRWAAYDGNTNVERRLALGSGDVASSSWIDSASTGAHLYTVPAAPNAAGPALIAQGTLFLVGALVQAVDLVTGKVLWTYTRSGGSTQPGGGSYVPSLNAGRLYLRAYEGQTLVLDAGTGHPILDLPRSDKPIAFDGTTGIFSVQPDNEPATISAVNLRTGYVYWSHTMSMVPIGPKASESTDLPGTIYALDEVTGATRSATAEPCPVAFKGMIAIAQHRLFTSSGCGLLTYTAQ